jgi:hypothetical protein
MEKVDWHRDLVGIAESINVGHRCTGVSVVQQVGVGSDGAIRSAGSGAANPETERLDAFLEIVDSLILSWALFYSAFRAHMV